MLISHFLSAQNLVAMYIIKNVKKYSYLKIITYYFQSLIEIVINYRSISAQCFMNLSSINCYI